MVVVACAVPVCWGGVGSPVASDLVVAVVGGVDGLVVGDGDGTSAAVELGGASVVVVAGGWLIVVDVGALAFVVGLCVALVGSAAPVFAGAVFDGVRSVLLPVPVESPEEGQKNTAARIAASTSSPPTPMNIPG